jgi:hypothetical protein
MIGGRRGRFRASRRTHPNVAATIATIATSPRCSLTQETRSNVSKTARCSGAMAGVGAEPAELLEGILHERLRHLARFKLELGSLTEQASRSLVGAADLRHVPAQDAEPLTILIVPKDEPSALVAVLMDLVGLNLACVTGRVLYDQLLRHVSLLSPSQLALDLRPAKCRPGQQECWRERGRSRGRRLPSHVP